MKENETANACKISMCIHIVFRDCIKAIKQSSETNLSYIVIDNSMNRRNAYMYICICNGFYAAKSLILF